MDGWMDGSWQMTKVPHMLHNGIGILQWMCSRLLLLLIHVLVLFCQVEFKFVATPLYRGDRNICEKHCSVPRHTHMYTLTHTYTHK